MKKVFLSIFTLLFLTILVACQKSNDNEIKVGVAFYPMKDILLLIEDDLKERGYNLSIVDFTDYQTANNNLFHKELDANMIQHQYFLNEFNKANNANLEIIAPIYHATFALYSIDYTDLEDIPNNSKITMPDDSTNYSRALYLLAQAGLITLKDNKTTGLTSDDIEINPKNLDLITDKVPLTTLANRYVETKLAVMYPTYARSLNLVGDEQRLYVEKQDDVTNGYAISLVARMDNKESDKIKVLVELIQTEKVRKFLIDNYSWASKPAF